MKMKLFYKAIFLTSLVLMTVESARIIKKRDLGSVFENLGNKLGNSLDKAWSATKNVGQSIGNGAKTAWGKVSTKAGDAWAKTKDVFDNTRNRVDNWWDNI